MIEPTTTAGLILAGGNARRMGGVDKGLVALRGQPLVQHIIARLSPQITWLAINANRSLDGYAAFGLPIFSDDEQWLGMGPLAGLASLAGHLPPHISGVQIAPCDTPFLPDNLVERLSRALNNRPDCLASYPQTSDGPHPSLLLVKPAALATLPAYLNDGGRKLRGWLDKCRALAVDFDDVAAFINVNDTATLQSLEAE